VRTSLFDRLEPRTQGARVLDLYAGSGALGIEALSRGALHATFVERDRRALAALRRNLADLELDACARVLSGDVEQALERLAVQPGFDVVLMDPPYGSAARTDGAGRGRPERQRGERGQPASGPRARADGIERSMGSRDPAGERAVQPQGRAARTAAGTFALSARAQDQLARLVVPGGCLVVERSRRDVVWDMQGFSLRDSRLHGETRLDWYERVHEEVA
jgi:16S rRNA G966 N2-methylase RsmD